MPVITVKIAKGRSIEQKQKFVEAVTKEAAKTLNVKEEWVTILFDEYERENWASNGELHSIKFRNGFGVMGTEEG